MFKGNIYSRKSNARSWREIIDAMGDDLVTRGNIESSYLEALCQREEEFPTGLRLCSGLGVSIPHATSEGVLCSAIHIGILDSPVKFRAMEDPACEIPVSFVFLLAIADPAKHVQILANLMDLFQDCPFMEELKSTKDQDTVVEKISERLQIRAFGG